MNRTNGGTNIGFWAVRVDNSESDFSIIIKAVAAKGSTEAQQFSDACRVAITGDLNEAKRAHFAAWSDAAGTVECEARGALIERSDARADYVIMPNSRHRARFPRGPRVGRTTTRRIDHKAERCPDDHTV